MDNVTTISLPKHITDDVKEEIILNARRLIDNNLARKASNTFARATTKKKRQKLIKSPNANFTIV